MATAPAGQLLGGGGSYVAANKSVFGAPSGPTMAAPRPKWRGAVAAAFLLYFLRWALFDAEF